MGKVPKFRGKRRYFRNLYKRANTFRVPNSPWFSLWHYHVDWYGWSTISGRSKRQHEEALMILLENVANQMEGSKIPYQVWAQIYSIESENNAVFIHTPNPTIKFPIPFVDVVWMHQIGRYTYGTTIMGKEIMTTIKC